MSTPQEKLQKAFAFAMENRPQVGGFPFLAECLRQAGVIHNTWTLPSCECIYVLEEGAVATVGTSLINGMADVPEFNKEKLIEVIRADQEGKTTFEEFLMGTWNAGVSYYTVDFINRTVVYVGPNGEVYKEEYAEVNI